VNVAKLKKETCTTILAHHYQSDEVIECADVVGDSLHLAKEGQRLASPNVILCGVYFMAEAVKLLNPNKNVYIPDKDAGCQMVDMASVKNVQNVWNNYIDKHTLITCYINSSLELKSFVGKNNGIICTSSNAKKIISWGLSKFQRIFFLPDQHLGRNSALSLGVNYGDIILINDYNLDKLNDYRLILWPGFCPIHMPYQLRQVREFQQKGVRVAVHPESKEEIAMAADFSGSTSYLIDLIKSNPNMNVAIGTESHLVDRLQKKYPNVWPLAPSYCFNMAKITLDKLKNVFKHLDDDEYSITLDESLKDDALKALNSMFDF
jgi:quinolinate synthase